MALLDGWAELRKSMERSGNRPHPLFLDKAEEIMSFLDDLKNLPADVEKLKALVPAAQALAAKVTGWEADIPAEITDAAREVHSIIADLENAFDTTKATTAGETAATTGNTLNGTLGATVEVGPPADAAPVETPADPAPVADPAPAEATPAADAPAEPVAEPTPAV